MEMGFNTSGGFETPDSSQGLRPLVWHELCVRLTAAQDLRRLMTRQGTDADTLVAGSFHRPAALFLAEGSISEGVVNPTSSANGKAPFATQFATRGRNPTEPC